MTGEQKALMSPYFHVGQVVPTKYFVGRSRELEYCTKVLLQNRGNLLLSGKWRIGKTSLIYKLIETLESSERPKLLPVYINLAAYFDRNIDNFLEDLIIHICAKAAKIIFNKEYSDLLFSLGESEDLFGADYKKLKRIFETIRSSQVVRERHKTSIAGVETVVKGTREEGDKSSIQLGKLFSYEFVNIAKEIVSICKSHGYERIIVFADEANKIATNRTTEILAEYFQVFSIDILQFIFVTSPQATVDIASVKNIFSNQIELSCFESKDILLELLRKYYSLDFELMYPELPFLTNAIDRIWTLTEGHPYLIQLLCDRGLQTAISRKAKSVEEMDILNAWLQELQRQPQITEIYKR